jgi:hypothetical protein
LNQKDRILNVLSYGINTYNSSLSINSIHAETNAIMNLPRLRQRKHLKKIDIFVIRTSSKGKLGMSKQCSACLLAMSTIPQTKGYIIKNILFTDENGNIINSTLTKLLNNENQHISRFYKNYY